MGPPKGCRPMDQDDEKLKPETGEEAPKTDAPSLGTEKEQQAPKPEKAPRHAPRRVCSGSLYLWPGTSSSNLGLRS